MRNLNRIVIIGAGAAGLTTAESLRRLGFGGEICMVNAEIAFPYDRPPLSKQVLAGTWPPEKVRLRSAAALDKLALTWHHGVQATRLDVAGHFVELSDGMRLPFDAAVIATGVAPRRLPSGHDLQGVFVLRTLDDTLALRQELTAGKRLVVVGGGFLGLEAAATARQLGLEVEVIEPLPVCLEGPLGRTIGERVMRLQTTHGVLLRNGIGVRRLLGDQEQIPLVNPSPANNVGRGGRSPSGSQAHRRPIPPHCDQVGERPPGSADDKVRHQHQEQGASGTVTAVELQDNTTVPADVVLVAIGAQPAIDWLANSGLTLQNGIVCNAFCEAAPDIYAAGDVASWYHPLLERHVRLEHRMNATEQGQAVARNILGERQPFAPIPFFWSDQFDVKLQMYGVASRSAELRILEGALAEDRFVAAYYEADERLVAVLGWNSPKQLLAYRQRLVATYTPSLETSAALEPQKVSGNL